MTGATALTLLLALLGQTPRTPTDAPPFDYVVGVAHHVLPETHNNESGYFSLCIGRNGKVYVGTAKYGVNAFLVEFDPADKAQRIVIDTHRLCGLDATGYAAQAKIHTRNFVGPSGRIYVGSKQGYPTKADESHNVAYPGGYVMVYDPAADEARCLGMPMAGQGVIDVVADEARGLLYVVTCEAQHWMLGDLDGSHYRELGPMLTPYAATIVDPRGIASAITADFGLAQYDPDDQKVTVRPILLDGQRWTRAGRNSIPAWTLAPDGRTAYVILLNDPAIITIDLADQGEHVAATTRGRWIEGVGHDSRSGLTFGPDGRVYALVRLRNDTGYGADVAKSLHHLVSFDPADGRSRDHGVLAVANPDFYPFDPDPNHAKAWAHGFRTLPDGTLTPVVPHMGLIAAPDGTLYATLLAPYTLLEIRRD